MYKPHMNCFQSHLHGLTHTHFHALTVNVCWLTHRPTPHSLHCVIRL